MRNDITTRSGITAAGTTVIDRIKHIAELPPRGTLAEVETVQSSLGGSPVNVLCDLSIMDEHKTIPLSLIACIGKDSEGDFILQKMKEYHIDTTYTHQTSEEKTSWTDVFTEKNGGQRTFFHYRGANRLLSIEDCLAITPKSRIFHLGYLTLLDNLDAEDTQYVRKAARLFHQLQNQGYTTSLDLVSGHDVQYMRAVVLPVLPYTDMLIINEVEAEMLSGVPLRSSQGELHAHNMEKAVRTLMKHGVRKLIVIHFPEGCCALTQEGACFMCASWKITEIKGSVGAGDAFCAGVLYGVHENFSLKDTLHLANASAACNLLHVSATEGAASISTLQKWMQKAQLRTDFSSL